MKKTLTIVLTAVLLTSLCALPARAGSLSISSQVSFSKGRTTVTWTDTGAGAPYQVAYEYYDGGSASQSGFWAGGNKTDATVYGRSYTFEKLIPGCRYIITVFDNDNNSASQIIQVPDAKPFSDLGIRASAMSVDSELRYIGADGTEKWPSVFILDQMLPYVKNDRASCGVSYKFEIPAISQKKTYLLLMVMRAPNGYTESVLIQDVTFRKSSVYNVYYTTCTGSDFFKRLLEKNGTIPVGRYTVEMYWDGMLVDRDSFTVKY